MEFVEDSDLKVELPIGSHFEGSGWVYFASSVFLRAICILTPQILASVTQNDMFFYLWARYNVGVRRSNHQHKSEIKWRL